jgi:hypothetical protein
VTDLERALSELAGHLDVPAAGDFDDTLTRRLTALDPGTRRRSPRLMLVAAAAAIVVASAGVVAVAPARHAVAGWLGIGAVEISRAEPRPIVTTTTRSSPSSTSTSVAPVAPTDLAAARAEVQFDIATPRDEAPPLRVAVDRRVPDGLVVLTYSHFTLVEIATDKTQPPPLGKLVGNAAVLQVKVQGHDGMWIAEPHSIAYIDRSGRFEHDTVRRSGPVLLWERDGVTYRVEGPHTLDEAMSIAESIA